MPIVKASEAEYTNIDWIPTGISGLDAILGGGIPTKRITEVFGPYSVGKTSLALSVVAEAQKRGMTTLWADVEWAWEPLYAAQLGVNLETLLLLQEQTAEGVLDELEAFAAKNTDALIVLDAIGALLPRNEAEKDSGGKTIGGQAGLVAKFCRKVVPQLAMHNIALVVLNHQFTDIMTGALKTSGGAKLEYHKSISLSLKRQYGKQAKRGSDGKIFEVVIEAEVRKNKLAGTLGSKHTLFMEPGKGFLKNADAFKDALTRGEVEKRGRQYFMGDTKLGFEKQAREAYGKLQGQN